MRSGAGRIWLTFPEHLVLRSAALLGDAVQELG
ncbi:hypothetical protein SAMN05216525_11430 [Bradyrhizobium sp. Gha]|nr:hypothetical protein SAMN05216525_11430 [Bradyrhizobium sp. Gha]